MKVMIYNPILKVSEYGSVRIWKCQNIEESEYGSVRIVFFGARHAGEACLLGRSAASDRKTLSTLGNRGASPLLNSTQ